MDKKTNKALDKLAERAIGGKSLRPSSRECPQLHSYCQMVHNKISDGEFSRNIYTRLDWGTVIGPDCINRLCGKCERRLSALILGRGDARKDSMAGHCRNLEFKPFGGKRAKKNKG